MNSKFLLGVGISVAIVSIPILLGGYTQFDFEDNSESMPIAVVTEIILIVVLMK